VSRGWPLIGRVEELSRISELTRGRDGPTGVVLAGPAGVGKTRLAREALAAAEQRGALTRWAVATASARALPLGAFAATLGVVSVEPARLVRQASEALLAGAGRTRVVVGVDDAHLLDEPSAVLVHQLVLRRAASVVLTLRVGETAPDAVTALWKDGHLPRLELRPLSPEETATLVEARLGGPIDSAVARWLWSITRGNVLYLRQLVEGELESGRLHQVAGVWRWSGQLTLSPGLVELISARIGQLPQAQREVLEVLAFAEPLDIPLLMELTNVGAVEEVEVRGLIEVSPDRQRLQARLAHPLYGEVQRAQTGLLHARRLRGRIAGALGATGRAAEESLRCAVLMLDSDLQPDPVLLTDAAHRASELGDLTLATRIARAAVAAGGGVESRLLLANTLSWSGRGAEADAELAAVGASAHTDAERVQATTQRVTTLAFALRRPAEAQRVLNTTASTISDHTAALELTAVRSVLDAYLGHTAQAAKAATTVLADPRCSPAAAQLAGWGLVAARAGLGHLEGIEQTLQRIDALAESSEIGLHQVAIVALWWQRGCLLAGLLDKADQVAQRYRERCQDTPGPADMITRLMSAEADLSRGQVHTAARQYRHAIAAIHGADPGKLSLSALMGLASALGMAGDATSARHTVADMTAARHPIFIFLEPKIRLAQAWAAAAEGAVSQAVALARQAAEVAATQHQPAVEVVALHTAVCFGDRTVADRLAQLATQLDGPRAPAAAAHAAALATDDGEALHAASMQLEHMGALLLAADAAAQAAAAHTHHNRRGSAHTATIRAHRLATACEGAPYPSAGRHHRTTTPYPPRARNRHPRRPRAIQPPNRPSAGRLGPHRRKPPLPRQHQTRHLEPRRTHHISPRPLTHAVPTAARDESPHRDRTED
jgi:AAA ATPase domain